MAMLERELASQGSKPRVAKVVVEEVSMEAWIEGGRASSCCCTGSLAGVERSSFLALMREMVVVSDCGRGASSSSFSDMAGEAERTEGEAGPPTSDCSFSLSSSRDTLRRFVGRSITSTSAIYIQVRVEEGSSLKLQVGEILASGKSSA